MVRLGWDPWKGNTGSWAPVCATLFPSPFPSGAPCSGDPALLRMGVGFPGAGAEGAGASLPSGSELEHSNYAGGFMSLCL